MVVVLNGTALSGGTRVEAGAHSPYMLTVFADVGWISFVALFLGWLAAIGGGSSAVTAATRTGNNVQDIRPAA